MRQGGDTLENVKARGGSRKREFVERVAGVEIRPVQLLAAADYCLLVGDQIGC